jgi:cytochrome c-type biogenesis protein CcmF
MIEVGYVALLVGVLTAAYGVVAALAGARRRDARLMASARNATFVVGGLVSHDFSAEYVARYTSRDLPLFYTLAAFWAGQEGSLLLWAWLLAGIAVTVVILNRRHDQVFLAYTAAVFLMTEIFFLVILAFGSNPFVRLSTPVADGQGLNPLLQNGLVDPGQSALDASRVVIPVCWHWPGSPMGLRGTGLGRVLGLGPRRER